MGILSIKMAHIREVELQSDNAGNYHGTLTASCLPIPSMSPIRIKASSCCVQDAMKASGHWTQVKRPSSWCCPRGHLHPRHIN